MHICENRTAVQKTLFLLRHTIVKVIHLWCIAGLIQWLNWSDLVEHIKKLWLHYCLLYFWQYASFLQVKKLNWKAPSSSFFSEKLCFFQISIFLDRIKIMSWLAQNCTFKEINQIKMCHYLLTLLSFQNFFLLRNTKEDILKNVFVHIMKQTNVTKKHWDIFQNIFFCVPQNITHRFGMTWVNVNQKIFILGELSLF